MSDNINGHVAIITQINLDSIMICEQNYKNIKWENNYSRILKFKYNNGYHIEDKNIIGWINILD
jgi:surface antigen